MKKRILFIYLGLIFALTARSQEMLVIKDTIDWTMQSTHGFYFYVQDYISKLPQNWRNPYDYYDGQFYIRFEIISEATNEPCQLQFGIWQYRLPGSVQDGQKNYSETMTPLLLMNGPGSVAYHNSSPATWWKSYEGVDFTRVYDFWRLGINIWAVEPRIVISPTVWGGDDALWATRSKWFPIKVYVLVVAVAEGYTFSGWNNYLQSPPPPPPAPSYKIDYVNETTDKIVPSTDEYSYNQNMSGAVSGTGQKLTLEPDKDVFFRTKAAGNVPASAIQSLDVSERPLITSPVKDTTNGIFNITTSLAGINTTFKNTDFTFTNCTISSSGTGTYTVTPGTKGDVKIKIKANTITGGNFASQEFKIYYKPLVSSLDFKENGENFLLFPQPAVDFLNIKTTDDSFLPLTLRINDINGREVMHMTLAGSIVDITSLPEGIYILNVRTSSGTNFIKKLVVAR